jgi:hypothetical protein
MGTKSPLGFADTVINARTGVPFEVSTVHLGGIFWQTAVLKSSGFFRTLFWPKRLYTHDCYEPIVECTHDAVCSMVREYPQDKWTFKVVVDILVPEEVDAASPHASHDV